VVGTARQTGLGVYTKMGVWNDRYCIIENRGIWHEACLGANGIVLVCRYEIVTIEE
jgi:hypothetical protein